MSADFTTLSIHPGVPTAESRDWMRLLAGMYEAWGGLRGAGVAAVPVHGEAAPYNVVRWEVGFLGDFRSYLSGEVGIHSLTRISPHDPHRRRHTSFCTVALPGVEIPKWPIRHYTLDPYKRVVDQRTGRETEEALSVLLGNLALIRDEEVPDFPPAVTAEHEAAHEAAMRFQNRPLTAEEVEWAHEAIRRYEERQ